MRTQSARSRLRGCTVTLLVVLGSVSLLSGAYLWMYLDHSGPTLVRHTTQADPPARPAYLLSAEQQQIIDASGYPDSFTLMFYQDLDEQGQPYDVRFECWSYSAEGRQAVFINGEQVSDARGGVPAPGLVAAPYRPEQFGASMRLKDVLLAAGIQEYARAAADPGLVVSGEVYFAAQIAFGMKAGQLMTVETVPLEAEG